MKHWLTVITAGLIATGLIGCTSPAQPISEPAATASPIATAVTPTVPAARSAPIQLEDCTIGTASARCGTYLLQHPDSVRTALINNSTLIDYPIFEHMADSSQRAFDLVTARCAKDEKCHAAYLIRKPISTRLSRKWKSSRWRRTCGTRRPASPSA